MLEENTRIKIEMSYKDVLFALSEGNPGALRVCIDLYIQNSKIDPDDIFPGLGPLLDLDTLGIYSSRIWVLYKDVCKENIVNMLAVLRAWQMSNLTKKAIDNAIDSDPNSIDIQAQLDFLKQKLPRFASVPCEVVKE